MSDACAVVRSLRKRWVESYGETIPVEDIRRYLNRLLQEQQEREIKAVFSGWTGKQLNDAIDVLFNYSDNDDSDVPAVELELPTVESDSIQIVSEQPKKRGRPVGWRKNKE